MENTNTLDFPVPVAPMMATSGFLGELNAMAMPRLKTLFIDRTHPGVRDGLSLAWIEEAGTSYGD
jgi:hypothetical protein